MYFVFEENAMHHFKKIGARLIKLNTKFIIVVIISFEDDHICRSSFILAIVCDIYIQDHF